MSWQRDWEGQRTRDDGDEVRSFSLPASAADALLSGTDGIVQFVFECCTSTSCSIVVPSFKLNRKRRPRRLTRTCVHLISFRLICSYVQLTPPQTPHNSSRDPPAASSERRKPSPAAPSSRCSSSALLPFLLEQPTHKNLLFPCGLSPTGSKYECTFSTASLTFFLMRSLSSFVPPARILTKSTPGSWFASEGERSGEELGGRGREEGRTAEG